MDALSIIAANQDLHMWQHPQGTDKEWPHNFLSGLYSRKFIRERSVNSILEIGFANGASLALWAHAFPKAKILGLDINDCTNPHPALSGHSNVTMIRADAYEQNVVESLPMKFQIVIDDGPHTVESQIRALQLYRDVLTKNGMLIIEDIAQGLRTARSIRKSSGRAVRKNLVFYDFRHLNNHVDNCLVVFYENAQEAKSERKLQPKWDQIAFASPVRLPSSLAIRFQRRRLFYGVLYRFKSLIGNS